MTQSIAFIRCKTEEEAQLYKKLLDHDLYRFLNNICRWGNFNNIRILQSFPLPKADTFDEAGSEAGIWNNFNLLFNIIEIFREKTLLLLKLRDMLKWQFVIQFDNQRIVQEGNVWRLGA